MCLSRPERQTTGHQVWLKDDRLRLKLTTLCLEQSTKDDDGDVHDLLRDGESVLQMLQRIKGDISKQSCLDDHLRHFETLNRLFRRGIAPEIKDGLFVGQGDRDGPVTIALMP